MGIKLHKHLDSVVTSKHNMQYDDNIYFTVLVIMHRTCSQLSYLPLVRFMVYILPTDVHSNKNLQTQPYLMGRSNSIHGCIRVHKTLTYTNLQGNYSI